MGCDGGTIPRRDELVRTKKKAIKTNKDIEKAAKWNNCHITQHPLQKPIVADHLGNVYNKDSVIEYLLERSKYEAGPEHIKGLKDVKELKLVPNPAFESNKQENADETSSLNRSKYICPVTGLELNGSFKFYFLISCGCVFSERAYKTLQSNKLRCLACEKPFVENDLIILNPDEGDIEINLVKIKKRKELAAQAKADKRSKNTQVSEGACASTSVEAAATVELTDDKKTNKKRSLDIVKNGRVVEVGSAKKVKGIQEDPAASEVYKSLFNTCDKAKNQTQGHWVTFNPQYF